jgi:hypothetical protein
VVVVEMLGVVKLDPVAKATPPLLAANQDIVPAEAVADKTAVPVPHIEAGVEAVIVGTVFTVATTAVLAADVQPLSVVST